MYSSRYIGPQHRVFHLFRHPKTGRAPPRKIFQFHRADHQIIKEAVEKFSTAFLLSSPELQTVDENWKTISGFLKKCMEDMIPSKMSKSRRHLPWITTELKRNMRKRDRLFKKARRNPSTSSWKTYREYRNMVAKLVRQAHHDYVNRIIGNSFQENPKAFFWSYVKYCRAENVGIPSLLSDIGIHMADKDKAECLNSFFHSVFTNQQACHAGMEVSSHYPDIGHLHIHRPDVAKQLSNLNSSKACGPDELPP